MFDIFLLAIQHPTTFCHVHIFNRPISYKRFKSLDI